jgi:hypothetical protein
MVVDASLESEITALHYDELNVLVTCSINHELMIVNEDEIERVKKQSVLLNNNNYNIVSCKIGKLIKNLAKN